MPVDRSWEQTYFDLVKENWAYCSDSMLRLKVAKIQTVIGKLKPHDPRHKEFQRMRDAL